MGETYFLYFSITFLAPNLLYSLSQFDVDARFLWAENRHTTREEDKAYSLFGIFDIQIPLLCGEGRDKALRRLRREIDKSLEGKR